MDTKKLEDLKHQVVTIDELVNDANDQMKQLEVNLKLLKEQRESIMRVIVNITENKSPIIIVR
jgi:predicted  nucleic acid-binding Zn-ribbon protein